MTHSVESITKVVTTIRKNLDFDSRSALGDLQTVTLGLNVENTADKILVLQLTDYIQYLLNMEIMHSVINNEPKLNALLANINLMEKSTVLIAKSFDEMRQQNDDILARVTVAEKENKLLRENVSDALKVWSRSDDNYEHPVLSEMANALTGKLL